jgi:hypothetical protein
MAEKDDGQVLNCCVDNQCFACGAEILGESWPDVSMREASVCEWSMKE